MVRPKNGPPPLQRDEPLTRFTPRPSCGAVQAVGKSPDSPTVSPTLEDKCAKSKYPYSHTVRPPTRTPKACETPSNGRCRPHHCLSKCSDPPPGDSHHRARPAPSHCALCLTRGTRGGAPPALVREDPSSGGVTRLSPLPPCHDAPEHMARRNLLPGDQVNGRQTTPCLDDRGPLRWVR